MTPVDALTSFFVTASSLLPSCLIWAAPLIVYRGHKRQSYVMAATARSISAIAIGFLGYWLPIWAAYCIERPFPGVDFDDWLGSYFLGTLPIILVYAILATISQIRVLRNGSFLSLKWRVPLVICVATFCWSPLISVAWNLLGP